MIALMLALAGAATQAAFLKLPLGNDDYPTSAIRAGEEGFQLTRVLISPTGSVEKCSIVVPSRYRDLDYIACARTMKATVLPAKDQGGIPVYGVIYKWDTWSISGPMHAPVLTDVTVIVNHLPPGLAATPVAKLTLVVDSSGKVEACEVSTSSGNQPLDTAACSTGVAAANVEAIKNVHGNAVRAVIPLNVGFSTDAAEAKQQPMPMQGRR